MKRLLPFLLVLPIGLSTYACATKSADKKPTPSGNTPPPGDSANPGGDDPNNPPPAGDGGTTTPDNPDDLSKNPIEGIAEAKPILQTDAFTDGPIWHAEQGVLFFATPLGNGALYRMRPDGSAKKVRDGDQVSGAIPIGNTIDKAGDLFTIEAKEIVRSAASAEAGAPEAIATGFNNGTVFTKFDTLNDAVVMDDGTMFVTDPGYFGEPITNRIYRISPEREVVVADAFDDIPRPNGIAFNPDKSELYVGFSQPMEGTMPFIRKYHMNPDGTLGESAKFIDIDPADSSPDGIEVDQAGNIFVATAQGVAVFTKKGEKIGVVAVPEQPTGMAFGNEDMKSLYVTTQGTRIWELRVNVPGIAQ